MPAPKSKTNMLTRLEFIRQGFGRLAALSLGLYSSSRASGLLPPGHAPSAR